MSDDSRPTSVGWWWLRKPADREIDTREIDGWLLVRVYSSHRGLTFRDVSMETPVTAAGYTWGGPVVRVDPLSIAEAYRLGREHERTLVSVVTVLPFWWGFLELADWRVLIGLTALRLAGNSVDFIESPPGRVPEARRGFLGELRSAIRNAVHEGWGRRLYTTPPPDVAQRRPA